MNSFFLGMQRSWILMFVGWVLGAHACLAEAEPLERSKQGEKGTGVSDLALQFHSGGTPSVLPCGRVLYPLRVVNQGPDPAFLTRIHFDFQNASLVSTTGCLNSLLQEGDCDLEFIQVGSGRNVTLIVQVDSDTSTIVPFNAIASGPNDDPAPNNNALSANTSVGPDSPPNLTIEHPLDRTIIPESDAPNGILLIARVTDNEDNDIDLGQEVEWRSDRLGYFGTGSEVMTGPIEDFGGQTITATVVDSCNNTASAEIAIAVAPNEPISTGSPILLDSEGEQGRPDIASTGANSFVVVWEDLDDNTGEDMDGSVRAQRFNTNGVPIGKEILVNQETEGLQHRPAVTGQEDGSFVVTWQGSPDTDPNSLSANIFVRQFDSQGTPSDELPVNISTTGRQLYPDVASDAAGGFLVAWESPSLDDPDGGVMARYFDSSGNAFDAFQVNSYTPGAQGRPAVVSKSANGFAVAWQSMGSLGSDDDGSSIQLRQFNSALRPMGDEIQVNRVIEGHQTDPAIDGNPMDDIVVAWRSTANDAQKRTLRVAGGTVNSLGEWSAEEFAIFGPVVLGPDDPPFVLSPPSVASSLDGDFVAMWADDLGPSPLTVRLRSFFNLRNSPAPIGDSLPLDDSIDIELPAIAYTHSDSESSKFFAFWRTENADSESTLDDLMEALDVEGSQISLRIAPKKAELSLVVSDTPDPATEGELLTYIMQATNLGPATALQASVDLETSGDGWTFLSSPDCSSSSSEVTCALGTLPTGAVRNLVVTGRVISGAPSSLPFLAAVHSATPGLSNEPVEVLGSTTVLSPPVEEPLFADGFESGSTSAWSTSVPFAPKTNPPRIED